MPLDTKRWAREFGVTYGGTLTDRAYTSFVQSLDRMLRRALRDALMEASNQIADPDARETLVKIAAGYAHKEKSS